MKERQIKKNNRKAIQLLMRLDTEFYTQDLFDHENGDFYWCSGGYEPEWDCEPAYDQLLTYLHNLLEVGEWVGESDTCFGDYVCTYKPDLSTAKKVFNLARKLILERGGN